MTSVMTEATAVPSAAAAPSWAKAFLLPSALLTEGGRSTGTNLIRRCLLYARCRSPCISTVLLGVWFGLCSRTWSKT